MNSFRLIKYRNIELLSYFDGCSVYSSILPVCRALNLDYHKEMNRIESLPPLISGSIKIPGVKDDQEEPLLFLPAYLFSGWLFCISRGDLEEDKVDLLHDLQATIHRMILSPWYGLFCFPPANSSNGEYAIRSVVYDTPNNAVREVRARSKSPVTLATSLLRDLQRIFAGTCNDDIPSL
ncbi:hypothetical protein S483_001302 [Salmonella enterica subsp. salamae]|nr:hypothetical protein [Salmonella enterica subsp. enterica]EEJ7233410.1 hypothetical protein [Salmonella enterica subsp. salamae]